MCRDSVDGCRLLSIGRCVRTVSDMVLAIFCCTSYSVVPRILSYLVCNRCIWSKSCRGILFWGVFLQSSPRSWQKRRKTNVRDQKVCWFSFDVENWNVRDCLKQIPAKFEAKQSHIWGTKNHAKFGTFVRHNLALLIRGIIAQCVDRTSDQVRDLLVLPARSN